MKIETLIELIDREFERTASIGVAKEGVMYLLDLYKSELVPNYTKPILPDFGKPNKYDWSDIPDKVPYSTICPCNPTNGGSGICGCVMGNQMVDNPLKNISTKLTSNTSTDTNI